MKHRVTVEIHEGKYVLRDDLLPGGTKAVLLPHIIGKASEYVYASPVYGGFQIALSLYCKEVGKQATIFCAKRKVWHPATAACAAVGAKIEEVKAGYLNVVQSRAKEYCETTGAMFLEFGAQSPENISLIAGRMQQVIEEIGHEPEEVWCAVGSGTLVQGILQGTSRAKVYGICVGKEFTLAHPRLQLRKYHRPFQEPARYGAPFPSMPNYDLKAWQYCAGYSRSKDVLFWNVL